MLCVRVHACVMIIEQWVQRSKEEKKILVVLRLCHSERPHSYNAAHGTPEAVGGLVKKVKS